MKKVLLLVVLLIVYGSFYPWRFQLPIFPANPLWTLLHSWPQEMNRYQLRDLVVNFTLYIPFGVLCFLALPASWPWPGRVLAALAAGMTLSASIEMAQVFAPDRYCSLRDLACNTAGTAAGIVLAASSPKLIARAVHQTEASGVWSLSESVALLYFWAGWLLFPFFPVLLRSVVWAKIHALANPASWTATDFFENLGGWLAAAALLEALLGERRLGRTLVCALMAIPLRLVIVNRTLNGAEMAGALAGVSAWLLIRTFRQPNLTAGIFAVGALITAALAPFRFAASPQPFEWIPFLPMLESPWESAFLTLLRKCFLYGSAVWLLQGRRLGWAASSLAVASALALTEALQRLLPGRSPEITDPVLALLLGFGLMQLQRRRLAATPVTPKQ